MIAIALLGCAYRLGIPDVTYTAEPEPLPVVRTRIDPRWYVPIQVEGVEGRVEGEPALWAFFVDTGYSYTTCDDGLIEALGLETRGRAAVRGELGKLQTSKARLPPILLGGHRLEGLVCQVRDLHATSSIRDSGEVPIAGVLGMDVLRPFIVRMDPQQARIDLLEPERAAGVERDDAEAVKLRRENWVGIRALVPVTVNGKTVWPVLDTGASGTHLDGERIGLEPSRVREGVLVRGSGAGGSSTRTIAYYEVQDLLLGALSPGEVVFAGRNGFGAGLLGLNVLSQFVATYDFASGFARFEPVKPAILPSWSEWRSAEYPPQGTRILAEEVR